MEIAVHGSSAEPSMALAPKNTNELAITKRGSRKGVLTAERSWALKSMFKHLTYSTVSRETSTMPYIVPRVPSHLDYSSLSKLVGGIIGQQPQERCRICEKDFVTSCLTRKEIQKHYEEHQNDSRLECVVCLIPLKGMSIPDQQAHMDWHFTRMGVDNVSLPKPKCNWPGCNANFNEGRTFPSIEEIVAHEKQHNVEKLRCPDCDVNFSDATRFTNMTQIQEHLAGHEIDPATGQRRRPRFEGNWDEGIDHSGPADICQKCSLNITGYDIKAKEDHSSKCGPSFRSTIAKGLAERARKERQFDLEQTQGAGPDPTTNLFCPACWQDIASMTWDEQKQHSREHGVPLSRMLKLPADFASRIMEAGIRLDLPGAKPPTSNTLDPKQSLNVAQVQKAGRGSHQFSRGGLAAIEKSLLTELNLGNMGPEFKELEATLAQAKAQLANLNNAKTRLSGSGLEKAGDLPISSTFRPQPPPPAPNPSPPKLDNSTTGGSNLPPRPSRSPSKASAKPTEPKRPDPPPHPSRSPPKSLSKTKEKAKPDPPPRPSRSPSKAPSKPLEKTNLNPPASRTPPRPLPANRKTPEPDASSKPKPDQKTKSGRPARKQTPKKSTSDSSQNSSPASRTRSKLAEKAQAGGAENKGAGKGAEGGGAPEKRGGGVTATGSPQPKAKAGKKEAKDSPGGGGRKRARLEDENWRPNRKEYEEDDDEEEEDKGGGAESEEDTLSDGTGKRKRGSPKKKGTAAAAAEEKPVRETRVTRGRR